MRYRVDASRSRLIEKAFAKGLLSAFGHNPRLAVRNLAGEAEFNPAEPHVAWTRMTAFADSLVVIDEMSEKDRREIERTTREELLEAARYPQIVFQSSTVTSRQASEGRYDMKIIGDLSLCGMTRRLAIDARIELEENELRAQGGFLLRLTDFNIRPISVAGGMLKLKDEVRLSFEIICHA
ncbi:MAG: YceI family protein [Chloracidobacterium sp.]|nr:YceI family protein [Chloracidobacterium sp.]